MSQQGFPPPRLRIGTRGSPLALFQAHLVRDRLAAAHRGLPARPLGGAVPLIFDRPVAPSTKLPAPVLHNIVPVERSSD